MAPTIIKLGSPRFRKKIAAFDYDHTLVVPKNGRNFPKDVSDYQWLFPTIPTIVKEFYQKGFMIIIFTNQSKAWKTDQIKLVLEELQIPITIVIAFDKQEYKPNRILFDSVIQKEWDQKKSFYVGDALGRKNDWSDSDKVFAENIGIDVKSPEDIFAKEDTKIPRPTLLPGENQEIIILTGFPGSGKSSIAKTLPNYSIISGDIHKTSKKMIKIGEEEIKNNKSVIFDATNPSKEKRAEFINVATKFNLPVRCVWVTTPFDESYQRNLARPEKERISRIVYNIYKKKFEEPSETEGCSVIKI